MAADPTYGFNCRDCGYFRCRLSEADHLVLSTDDLNDPVTIIFTCIKCKRRCSRALDKHNYYAGVIVEELTSFVKHRTVLLPHRGISPGVLDRDALIDLALTPARDLAKRIVDA